MWLQKNSLPYPEGLNSLIKLSRKKNLTQIYTSYYIYVRIVKPQNKGIILANWSVHWFSYLVMKYETIVKMMSANDFE